MIQKNTRVYIRKNVTIADWLPLAVVLLVVLFLFWTLAYSVIGIAASAINGALFFTKTAPDIEQVSVIIWAEPEPAPVAEYMTDTGIVAEPEPVAVYTADTGIVAQPEPMAAYTADVGIMAEPEPMAEYIAETVILAEQQLPLSLPLMTEKSLTPITVNAVGDCMLATGLGRSYVNSFEYHIQTLQKPYEYFFDNVREIFSAGDINIANGENAFTRHDTPRDKSSHGDRVFWFKSDPDYAKIYVAGGINAVNVANNHARDFGEEGLKDTFKALQDVGVQPFGFGRIAYMEVNGYTIALLGYSLVSRLETEEHMQNAARAIKVDLALAAADIMIVSFHWGEEYAPEPSPLQERLAQLTIDHGAHLVLGHHSHSLQRIELYQERLIAYSLGNFVFGGSIRPPKETVILRQTFFMDDELRQLDHMEYEIIEAETYGGGGNNNFQPVLGRPSSQ